jgi:undecaprenyl diphosphate synthase
MLQQQRETPALCIPTHIAFIMDGNGRWATSRGMPRSAGHKAGYEHIREVLEICYELGVEVVSCYAWSTENWGRPPAESGFIIRALEKHLLRFVEELHQRNVRFVHSGTCERLPPRAVARLQDAVALTRENDGGVFNLAFNYGGRAELVEAARRLLAEGLQSHELCEQVLERHLWTAGLPDVDLVIRSGGDRRISNFLLWQSAYAAVYIADNYWPDLSRDDIMAGIGHMNRCRKPAGVLAATT